MINSITLEALEVNTSIHHLKKNERPSHKLGGATATYATNKELLPKELLWTIKKVIKNISKTTRTSSWNFWEEGTGGANKYIKLTFISKQENANENQYEIFYTRLAKIKMSKIAKIREDIE